MLTYVKYHLGLGMAEEEEEEAAAEEAATEQTEATASSANIACVVDVIFSL